MSSVSTDSLASYQTAIKNEFREELKAQITDDIGIKSYRMEFRIFSFPEQKSYPCTAEHTFAGPLVFPKDDEELLKAYGVSARAMMSDPKNSLGFKPRPLADDYENQIIEMFRPMLPMLREQNKTENRLDGLFSRIDEFFENNLKFHLECHPGEAKIQDKSISVTCCKKSKPTEEFVLRFEKNYERQCKTCGKERTTAHKILRCMRCLNAHYCDPKLQEKPTCQKVDWDNGHKDICKKK